MTVVRVDMPESTGVHVHEPQHHRHVATARALLHRVSSMSTLTAFVPLCVQTNDSFDFSELFHAEGAASRERTGGLGAGSRM